MGGEFTRLVSLADLITHAVPLSKSGEDVIYTNAPITNGRVGFLCARSEPISSRLGIRFLAAIANKTLWCIGCWHPSRFGGLGDGTGATIGHEAIVGETT